MWRCWACQRSMRRSSKCSVSTSAAAVVGDMTIFVPLGDVIDLDAERDLAYEEGAEEAKRILEERKAAAAARFEAMAEAGHFLRDARETAGLSVKDLAESLGISDKTMLEDIESGQTIMPLELMLRSASLLARHDPIPFLIKFMRTYNPALEKTLEA